MMPHVLCTCTLLPSHVGKSASVTRLVEWLAGVSRTAGRKPRTETLNCDKAGVKLDASGAVIVDEAMKTSVDNIYAVGDVVGAARIPPQIA